MKAILKFIPLLLLFAFLIACNNTTSDPEEQTNSSDDKLEVSFDITPNQTKVNEQITFTLDVILDGKSISEVDELVLEIWRENDEGNKHRMADIAYREDGKFYYDTTFEQPGLYYVTAHVSMNGKHKMSEKTFTITE